MFRLSQFNDFFNFIPNELLLISSSVSLLFSKPHLEIKRSREKAKKYAICLCFPKENEFSLYNLSILFVVQKETETKTLKLLL